MYTRKGLKIEPASIVDQFEANQGEQHAGFIQINNL